MTTYRAHLACKFVDLAAEVIKEVLRSREGIPTKASGLSRTPLRPVTGTRERARKLMDR